MSELNENRSRSLVLSPKGDLEGLLKCTAELHTFSLCSTGKVKACDSAFLMHPGGC